MARLSLSCALLFCVTAALAQNAPPRGGGLKLPTPGSRVATPPAAAAPKSYAELKPYGSCEFPDGLRVLGSNPMPADVHERPVQMHGVTKSVPLLAGQSVVLGYPDAKEPYASVKVELLPAENYATNRKLLLEDFDDIVASDKHVAKNAKRAPTLNSFAIEGLDRDELKGNTLGIYLLLDDHTHVAATVYLLNPEGPGRKFKTLAEYGQMRDTFLYNYTRCVRNNQTGALFGSGK